MTVERPDVEAAVAAVPDPELPPVTLGMLGMVHAVTVTGNHVRVELLPTFAGCPAIELMARDVEMAVLALGGIGSVEVVTRFDPPWTPARITAEGREALRSFGIAPPVPAPAGVLPNPETSRRHLPLVASPPAPRPCPYCGSEDTEQDSAFGPTPCRAMHFCRSCSQPFEAFKS